MVGLEQHIIFSESIGMVLTGLVNFFIPLSMVVDPTCDYYQQMQVGTIYYAYSRGYPSYYKSQQACRWTALSEPGTRIIATCNPVDISPSQECQREKLLISLSGNGNFTDSHKYCGSGNFTIISDYNVFSIGLFAPSNTNGGRFMCSLTAFLSSQPTTSAPTGEQTCDCGWRNQPRIVGGSATGVNEFPATAGLVNSKTRMIFCGVTLISERYAITAAHCNVNENLNSIGILVGDWDISTGEDTTAAHIYLIERFISHPLFKDIEEGNDIGLVKTTEKMKFDNLVGPACLPFRFTSATFEGQFISAMGWGTLEFHGIHSNILQYVSIQVISNSQCNSIFKNTGKNVTTSQICTLTEGKDACQSDSGGPLYWFDSELRRLQLVGVISYGVGCATSYPGVNTRVTSYLDWILSETTGATFCIK